MKKIHKLSRLFLILFVQFIFSLYAAIPSTAKIDDDNYYGTLAISDGIESSSNPCFSYTYRIVVDAPGIGCFPVVNPTMGLQAIDFSGITLYYQSALGYQNAQCVADGVPKASGEEFNLSPDSSNPTQIVCTAEPIPEPEPEFTLSMAVPDKVDLSILPTAEGKLGSESFDIVVTTDNPTGYTLSMYNESSDLVNDTASATIPTLDNEVSKVDFPVNRWGYSLDDAIYKPILKETKTVLKTTDAPDDEDITTFNLATKINTEKPAGDYSNTFVFNAVANQSIFTVTWDANGGTVSPSTSDVKYDTAIGTLPTPTYDGHNFLGWFTETEGGEEVTAETKVTKDVTYYARWEEIKSFISFSISGGSSPKYPEIRTYQAEENMTWNNFINSSYNLDNLYFLDNQLVTPFGCGTVGTEDIIIANEIYRTSGMCR